MRVIRYQGPALHEAFPVPLVLPACLQNHFCFPLCKAEPRTIISRSMAMQANKPVPAPGFSNVNYTPGNEVPCALGTYQADVTGAGGYFQVQPMGVPAGLAVPPIQNQPIVKEGTIWMPVPPPLPNCPPGLEYLTQIDQILIHQQIELLEILTGFETNNKYEIKNTLGQRVYFAAEDNDCCTRNCCGPSRPFTIRIIDNLGHEVITLQRPLRCSSCCFPCCLQELEVQAPPGTPVGYVVQNWHPCLPKFTIQNEKRMDILKIVGPCVVCSCCEDIHFEVKSVDETASVGRISKQWTGFLKEAFTDADNFGITFPMDLDVKMKAVMIGACFLIDFMFFEHAGDNQQRTGVWQ
ncbi:phospholipid scramblase 1 isoform X1 [Grus americana]|uniref:phospholipid scramblase 1 isoform X1 n=2 Tax=Grus americana TaxID=9117 RepID=UPI0024085ED8|nr:phospholipid scramblase 1 isoform X1 [Grus americana]XP_054691097.1 phospholipid scramblase 1 isoform X1 [Grus americana]XP_054691099.1 phospholipid scramblase 1 isoform X1 [Grus americana]XP_054691100.1 phospholipid scramblase 1 isoform X1 [Grus americana]XP_054691101.1 phospholipid scramblase 1 isoform X1 [Grus americana]XP_054691102.1 phospholipid scramblase 1 isoform X1 [Grus americana]